MKEKLKGICEWFGSNGQSFGFIKGEDGQQIYCHYKQILPKNLRDPRFKEMRKGDKVEFYNVEGYNGKGTQASEVEIIEHGRDQDKEESA